MNEFFIKSFMTIFYFFLHLGLYGFVYNFYSEFLCIIPIKRFLPSFRVLSVMSYIERVFCFLDFVSVQYHIFSIDLYSLSHYLIEQHYARPIHMEFMISSHGSPIHDELIVSRDRIISVVIFRTKVMTLYT